MGPALETIEQLDDDFDFVFVDADKENYRNYYEAILPRLSEHALIAFDNTLWSGRVVEEDPDDETTRIFRELNDALRDDDRITCVMLSVRDGITLVRRR
jgi:caffeoyl-CoA O-methyltransferase